MEIALIVLGSLAIVATLLPLVPSDVWWIRVWDFPRIQVGLLAVASLVAYVAFGDLATAFGTTFTVALAICAIYQLYMILPYTPLAGKQVQTSRKGASESSLDVIFANVLMENRDAKRLVEIVDEVDPDVFLAIETDEWWCEQLAPLEKRFPYVVREPLDNTYGMVLFSKLELVDPEVRFLIADDIPSIHALAVLRSGEQIELHCVHPKPPFIGEAEHSTQRDAELIVVGKDIKTRRVPAVVFGDLNDVAWSRTNYLFQDISGLLDPRIGRGFFNTFHAKYPFVRFPLDHFFHSNHFRLIDMKRLGAFGSDHFPVYISLSFEPEAQMEQEEPEASGDEREEADEQVARAKSK